jgi:hypothetical protein
VSTLLFFFIISPLVLAWAIAVLVWLGEIPGDEGQVFRRAVVVAGNYDPAGDRVDADKVQATGWRSRNEGINRLRRRSGRRDPRADVQPDARAGCTDPTTPENATILQNCSIGRFRCRGTHSVPQPLPMLYVQVPAVDRRGVPTPIGVVSY